MTETTKKTKTTTARITRTDPINTDTDDTDKDERAGGGATMVAATFLKDKESQEFMQPEFKDSANYRGSSRIPLINYRGRNPATTATAFAGNTASATAGLVSMMAPDIVQANDAHHRIIHSNIWE